MKKLATILFLSALMSLSVACGGDDGGGGDDVFPELGTQLDRAGRAAISTALIESFLFTDATAQAAGKDSYSQDANAAGWVGAHSAEMEKNLAILDALDSNVNGSGCGNQLAFSGGYGGLADVLADDRLLIDASQTSCDEYLAVEANLVLGAGTVVDCGGRSPVVDSVRRSYSVLAAGALDLTGSGVDADDATHNDSTFPYLAAP